jgi:hypothetical protein
MSEQSNQGKFPWLVGSSVCCPLDKNAQLYQCNCIYVFEWLAREGPSRLQGVTVISFPLRHNLVLGSARLSRCLPPGDFGHQTPNPSCSAAGSILRLRAPVALDLNVHV